MATRSKNPCTGNNPISLAAQANNGDSFILDMAVSSVALGKIEVADLKGHEIPDGWAIDKEGKPLKNAKDFHGLLPLGGDEKSSK